MKKSLALCLSAIAAIVFLTGAGLFWIWPGSGLIAKTNGSTAENTDCLEAVSIDQPQPGWWQSRQLIYYNIPARVRFYLPNADRQAAERLARQAWAEFDRIGRIFNPSDPESETSRLNAADKTEPVRVSEDLYTVLKLSRRLWKESNGAFDPTTAPLKRLWQGAVKTQKIPTSRDIQKVLTRTGFENVRLLDASRSIMCTTRNIIFDFGGIAKGFAVDRTKALLRDAGVERGLVQLGGEVAAFGPGPEGSWRIGIQHPAKMTEIWDVISSPNDIQVSTSGNYRQPLVIQGHAFYHIFSPDTGRPVSEKILGVTTAAFSPAVSSALLDAAATAIAVLGAEKGLELAEKVNIQALVLSIDPNGEIQEQSTPNLSDSRNANSKDSPASAAKPSD